MTDRINTDECISRFYHFLNKQKDWQKAADIKADGTIIRTEFSAYILNSGFKFNDGENKADLIAAFWKSIDVNVKGKVDISRISNKNALDSSELATVEKNMEAESKVDSFVRTNYVCPSGLENNTQRIRESVKAGILNRAIELLNNGGDISELTDSKLQEFYQVSMNKTTADYKAIAMIDEQVKQKYGNDIDYKSADDEVRADIIDDYISQLNGTETQEQVSKDVEAIVNAYMDTAETNSTASTNLLAQYGYDPMDDLNPLQAAVLTKDLTEKVLKYLQSSNSDIVTGSFKEQAEAMVKAFVEEYLKDKRADEFSSLKNLNVSSNDFSSLITDINEQYTALKQAQQSLKDYVDSVLDENNAAKTRAVGDAVGSSEKTRAHDIIDKMTSVDDVDRVKSQLEALIDAINRQLPDNFLDAITDISIASGESKTIKLQTSVGAYSTGELVYKVENGNSNISVDSTNGTLTISGNQVGIFKGITVSVYNLNGEKLSSKTITITVNESVSDILNSAKTWGDVDDTEHLEVFGKNYSGDDGHQMTDYNIGSLYDNDAIIRLDISEEYGLRSHWNNGRKNVVIERLTQTADYIVSALSTLSNINSSILAAAAKNVVNSYVNAGPEMYYEDDGGITANTINQMETKRSSYSHKIIAGCDDDGAEEVCYMIRFKDFVDDIMKEYNRLAK